MDSFISLLERRVDDCSSLLCVGLDPHGSELPEQSAAAARDFCVRIIKATALCAAAFKPHAAFFEAFGSEGWTALKQVIDAIREESERTGSHIPVILDAKRGDIASTAEAYAKSAFENLGADCITLSPYLGGDSIEPFIRDPARGVFLLCKTSNPGAGDLQDLVVMKEGTGKTTEEHLSSSRSTAAGFVFLHEYVARLAHAWNTKDNIGLVVGATYPETLERVRALAPDLWFLVPGVGTQGGDLEAALKAGLRADGNGLLINVSRGISRSADPGSAAREMREQISRVRESSVERQTSNVKDAAGSRLTTLDSRVSSLADSLLAAGCIKFGEFTLKSGLKSPIYIDLRQIISYPRLLEQIGAAYLSILKQLQFDRIAGLRPDGKGLLVNVSRGISRSADPRKAAAELRDQMREIRESTIVNRESSRSPVSYHESRFRSHDSQISILADSLLAAGCIKFGDFTLKSGLQSPIYVDLRQIISYPRLLEQIGAAYLPILKGLQFDRIAGLPYAAIPIATSVSVQGGYPMIYPRKEVKAYGTKAEIEGEYHAGETVVIIDDLATTGGSKFEAIEKLTGAGLKVKDVVVLVDRQSGAKEALAEAGYAMHAVLTITEMLDDWEKTHKVDGDKIRETREFLQQTRSA